MNYKIGNWQVVPTENKLIHTSTQELLHLEPKAMMLLNCLAESQGQVVGIEDLIEKVWMGRVVGNHAVYRIINQLRRSLDVENRHSYLVTIPKKGYQLIQTVVYDQPHHSDAAQDFKTPSSSKIKPILGLITAVLLFVAVVSISRIQSSNGDKVQWPYYNHAKPITTQLGNETDAQYSPDGHYIAYAKQIEASDTFNLYVLNLSNNQESQVTDSEYDDLQPVLSALAERLVYIKRDADSCEVMLLNNPLTKSAQESKLIDCDWQNMDLALSADGETLYFTQSVQPNDQHKIFSLNIATERIVQLTTIRMVNSQGDRIISLSPDGCKLAFLRDTDWQWSTLGILDLKSYQQEFYIKTAGWLNGLAWTPDSKNIIYQDSSRSLSLFDPVTGQTHRVTTSFTEDIINISHNSVHNKLAVTFGSRKGGILIKENPQTNTSQSLQLGYEMIQSKEVDFFPNFANRSNQLAFMSKRTGDAQIWLKTERGEILQISQFNDQRSVRTIRWSPNDAYVLTETDQSISYIDIEEKTLHTLIAENRFGSVGGATWDEYGNGIFFASEISGDSQIYHLDMTTSTIRQITSKGGVMAFPSDESEWLYLLKNYQTGLWKLNTETGEEILIIRDIDSSLHRSINVVNSGIYYVSDQGLIKFYAFVSQTTKTIDVGINLMVPVLSVSHDEKLLAFPHYDKKEASIFLLSN